MGYSKAMLNKAKILRVVEDRDSRWFRVTSSKSVHRVRFIEGKEPIKSLSCDCYWYANRTVTGDKFCSHILAVISQKLRFKNPAWEFLWKTIEAE
jgi:hypothetical protein